MTDDWMERAACKGDEDDQKWFPDKGGSPLRAKAVCRTCTAVVECLAYALSFEPRVEGVWGGTTVEERKAIVRRKPVPKRKVDYVHGTEYAYRREVDNGEDPCPECIAARDLANARRSARAKRAKAKIGGQQ